MSGYEANYLSAQKHSKIAFQPGGLNFASASQSSLLGGFSIDGPESFGGGGVGGGSSYLGSYEAKYDEMIKSWTEPTTYDISIVNKDGSETYIMSTYNKDMAEAKAANLSGNMSNKDFLADGNSILLPTMNIEDFYNGSTLFFDRVQKALDDFTIGGYSYANEQIQVNSTANINNEFEDISDYNKYPGIKIFSTNKISGGVTIPGVGIFVDNKEDKALIQHEYGHFRNYKYWESRLGQSIAMPLYHSLISIPSALNMAFDRMFDTEYHANFYTESWADNFAKEYFKDDYEGHKDSRFSTYGKK